MSSLTVFIRSKQQCHGNPTHHWKSKRKSFSKLSVFLYNSESWRELKRYHLIFLHKQACYPGLSVWFSLFQRKFLLYLSQSHFVRPFKEKEGSQVSLQITGIVQEKMFATQPVFLIFLRLSRRVFHCNSWKSPKRLKGFQRTALAYRTITGGQEKWGKRGGKREEKTSEPEA